MSGDCDGHFAKERRALLDAWRTDEDGYVVVRAFVDLAKAVARYEANRTLQVIRDEAGMIRVERKSDGA